MMAPAHPHAENLRFLYAADRLFGALLLMIALPIILFIALIVWILSRRSPFLAHERIGRHGTRLAVLKIRTMWPDESPEPEETGEPVLKRGNDPRVSSAFARFCRRHSLDELPQLLQVARGHMSLVGPRPLTHKELACYYGNAQATVTGLRPGLSGLWQVRGRNRLTYRQRRRLDLFLVRHYSFGLYFRIILATVASVLNGRDAW